MSCNAPWNHLWQETTGKIKPCCVFNGNVYPNYDSLQEAFDSKENLALRKQMLNREDIAGCRGCTIKEDFDVYTRKKPKLRDIELSFDNNCNYKCVTCESKFSRLLFDDDLALKELGFDRNPIQFIENSTDLSKNDFSELRKIRIAGGEPFLNKKILDFIQTLNLPELAVYINTNNSIFPTKWIPTIQQLKRFRLIVSLDGIDEVGEFSRYHMKMNVMTKNLKKWKKLAGQRIILSFNFVSHSLNVLNIDKTEKYISELGFDSSQYDWYIKEYYDWYIKEYNGTPWNFQIMTVDNCKYPKHLDVALLPKETKKLIEKKIKNEKVLNYLWTKETDKNECIKFLKYCNYLETTRPMNLPEETEIIYNSVVKNL